MNETQSPPPVPQAVRPVVPPPLPPGYGGPSGPLPYATPKNEEVGGDFSDRVTGINVRLHDNLMQLAAVAVSAAIGYWAAALTSAAPPLLFAIVAAVIGLLVSGTVIGLYRQKRRPRQTGRSD